MPRGDESSLPPGVLVDRRTRADRRRVRAVDIARVLGSSPDSRPGLLTVRAVDFEDAPVLITLTVEAAMTLLNDLQGRSTESRWFDIEPKR